jgi:hypothetical protein
MTGIERRWIALLIALQRRLADHLMIRRHSYLSEPEARFQLSNYHTHRFKIGNDG